MLFSKLSEQIVTSLQLSAPPIALAFMDEPPAGVSVPTVPVPSACAFWVQAERQLFFAPANLHENCPIGMLALGFPMSDQVKSTLNEFVSMMCNVSYLGKAEPPLIPSTKKSKNGILYGPLAQFPILPDLSLMWANSRQAMILEEALGAVCWNTLNRLEAFGRPSCAALASAMNQSRSTVSLGCSGMRTFTSVSDDLLLISIPSPHLAFLSERLGATIRSNETMLEFYRQHQRQFSAV